MAGGRTYRFKGGEHMPNAGRRGNIPKVSQASWLAGRFGWRRTVLGLARLKNRQLDSDDNNTADLGRPDYAFRYCCQARSKGDLID